MMDYSKPRTVLVIEDEVNLQEVLKYNFEKEGYKVFSAYDGDQGLRMFREVSADIIVLDVMLPLLDGMELCRILRRETDLPIIMLTAKGEEIDRVLGLELGADDYLTKPFSVRELIARVKNILRRASYNHEHVGKQVITSSDLTVNLTSHTVFVRDKIVDLRPREFDLLVLLMLNRGRVFTRDYVLERLWGYDYIGSNRTVDVHVRWIREKIEQNPSKPNRIVTIRGVGYRFDG